MRTDRSYEKLYRLLDAIWQTKGYLGACHTPYTDMLARRMTDVAALVEELIVEVRHGEG